MKIKINILLILLLLCSYIGISQSQTSYIVSDINGLKAYSGNANKLFVTSKNTEFTLCSTCIVDSITIIQGNNRIWKLMTDTLYTEGRIHVRIDSVGNRYIYEDNSDGFVIKPIVTWSGFGLTYYATNGAYYIGGKYYESPSTTITLSPADATYSTQYVFVVDTLGRTYAIRGIPASLPLLPADTIGYQLPITSGITIAAGATVPPTVFSTIYDEGIGEPSEFTYADNGGISAYTTNTANFFVGTHSTLVSTYSNSRFYWYDNVDHAINSSTSNDVLNYHIWLNTPMTNSIYMVYLDHTGFASNYVRLGTAQGFNPNQINQWQNISLPNSQFNWTSNKYDGIGFEMVGNDVSGAGGFYVDYINIQPGINLPNQTDYSNKVDSTTISGGNEYYWIKGISHLAGAVSGGGGSSGCPVTFYTTTDSLYYVRDSCGVLDSTQYVGSGSSGVVGNYKLPYNGITTNYLGGDSILHPLPIIPAQFNPIAGTNVTLSGTYPNITFNSASGGSGISQSVISDTLKAYPTSGSITTDGIIYNSPIALAVANHLITGSFTLKSQNAYTVLGNHTSGSASPTFGKVPLQGLNTTGTPSSGTFLRGDGNWATGNLSPWLYNSSKIYYNGGNVGIGTDTAFSKLQVIINGIGNIRPFDSSSVLISNTTPSTFSVYQNSPAFLTGSIGWNLNTSTQLKGRAGFYTSAPNRNITAFPYTYPTINFIGSIPDSGLAVTYATLGYSDASGGNLNINNLYSTAITSTVGIFSGISASNGISSSRYTKTTKEGTFGTSTIDSSAVLTIGDNNMGFRLPRLTQLERDSIFLRVSSITIINGGSGYISTNLTSTSIPVLFNVGVTGTTVVSGGVITGVNITSGGYYNSRPLVSPFGGSGTGAVFQANMSQATLPAGLTIYCTNCIATDSSTGVTQTYNGTSWKNNW